MHLSLYKPHMKPRTHAVLTWISKFRVARPLCFLNHFHLNAPDAAMSKLLTGSSPERVMFGHPVHARMVIANTMPRSSIGIVIVIAHGVHVPSTPSGLYMPMSSRSTRTATRMCTFPAVHPFPYVLLNVGPPLASKGRRPPALASSLSVLPPPGPPTVRMGIH